MTKIVLCGARALLPAKSNHIDSQPNLARCACRTAEGGRPHTIFATLRFLELLLLHALVNNYGQIAADCTHCRY